MDFFKAIDKSREICGISIKLLDGTPESNDLPVRIAKALMEAENKSGTCCDVLTCAWNLKYRCGLPQICPGKNKRCPSLGKEPPQNNSEGKTVQHLTRQRDETAK